MYQHFIITQFSIRKEYFIRKKALGPLRSKSLDHRFVVFEITCLPSILSQTNQDFTWIILVDPELPLKYRTRLIQLVSSRHDTHLVDFHYDLRIHKLDWLKPWLNEETQFVITTVFDDDDAISCGFTEYFKTYFNGLSANSQIPPILFFGNKNFLYWDFFFSKNAPFGYFKKDDSKDFITGAGLTICTKYPEINFSVLMFPHHFINALKKQKNEFESLTESEANFVFKINQLLNIYTAQFLPEWNGVLGPENFHIIMSKRPNVIVLNHLDNIQYHRIFDNYANRSPVIGSESFQGFQINLLLAEKYILKFRKTTSLLIKLIINHFLVFPGKVRNHSIFKLFYIKFRSLPQIIRGYLRLR